MTFPIVNGSNLLREKLTLPQDFAGKYNLLFIAFQQWHQEEVNSWIPLAKSCEARFAGLVYYELPTIRALNAFLKFSSMRACGRASQTQNRANARLRFTSKKMISGQPWTWEMKSTFSPC